MYLLKLCAREENTFLFAKYVPNDLIFVAKFVAHAKTIDLNVIRVVGAGGGI